jgi:hypothetical protein
MRGFAVGLSFGTHGVARIVPLVVWIRPLGRIRLAHRGVEDVMRVLFSTEVAGVLTGRLGEAGWGLGFRVMCHAGSFPPGLGGLTEG